MTTTNIPTPSMAELKSAFLHDGLSVSDTANNEWVEMQETVAHAIFAAADEAGIRLGADDMDAVYDKADAIVARLDYAGEVR